MSNRTPPGRLRCRLEQLLARLGFMVRAAEIVQNPPTYRASDGIAWEVYGTRLGSTRTVRLYSWDTMKQCCAEGILIGNCGDGTFEVSAVQGNEKPVKHIGRPLIEIIFADDVK